MHRGEEVLAKTRSRIKMLKWGKWIGLIAFIYGVISVFFLFGCRGATLGSWVCLLGGPCLFFYSRHVIRKLSALADQLEAALKERQEAHKEYLQAVFEGRITDHRYN
jgi:hypothetical protein